MSGLTDTTNPAFPLLADGFSTTVPVYDANKANKGGIWAANKAIVIFCDASGQIMKVASDKKLKRSGNATQGLFETGTDWLDTGGDAGAQPGISGLPNQQSIRIHHRGRGS